MDVGNTVMMFLHRCISLRWLPRYASDR